MTVLVFGVLPACRGSERRSEASEVRPTAGASAIAETGESLPEVSESSATKPVSGLCLELLAPRPRAVVGEPVMLIVSLANCSSVPRDVPEVLAPGYRFLSTLVTRPGETKEVPFEPGYVRDSRGKADRTLRPGERLSAWIPLHADRSGWFLDRPGTYRVRSVLALEGNRIESNSVAVEVQSSPDSSDARAAEIFMSPELGRWSLEGATPGSKGWSSLESIPKEYPESRLAPYALLATGITRTRTVFDPSTKSFRKPDCPRAVEELQRALPRVGDPLLAAQGTAALSECLEALGRSAAARESVSQYFRAHPRARELPGVAEVFRSPTSAGDR